MNAGKVASVISAILCAVSLAMGIWSGYGVMATFSAVTLCFTAINIIHSPDRFRLAIITSIVLIVCTILITTVLSYETLVSGGTMTTEM